MTSPILFAGQEDLSFTPVFSAWTPTIGIAGNTWAPDTTATAFRAGYARYALSLSVNANGTVNQFLQNAVAFSASNFWTSSRVNPRGGGTTSTTSVPMEWHDAAGVLRLRIRYNGSGSSPSSLFVVEKVNAAGTATQLGSASTDVFGTGTSLAVPDKIDVFINYAVSGQVQVYRNLTLIYDSGTVDVTTDGNSSLAFVRWGNVLSKTGASFAFTCLSEMIVATRDTRNMSLATQAPSAAGNTDTFTSGAFGNVNGNLVNQASPDFSQTAAQIQQYKVGQAIPAGSFSVLSVVQHGQVTLGPAGPQHIEFNVRTGGADFFTADMSPSAGWGLLTNNWDLNPNTSAAWQTTDLASASTAFNIGVKSTT